MDDSGYEQRRRLGGRPLLGTADGMDGMPRWFENKMRLLHPLCRNEFENLLLARLCADEVALEDPRRRPLTVGEVTVNWGPELVDMLLMRYGFANEAEARLECAATRDAWISEDIDGYFEALNTGYGSSFKSVRKAMTGADGDAAAPAVYIMTSRKRRHAQALLRRQGLQLADSCVLGELGREGKRAALTKLRAEHPSSTLRFIDDDAVLLREVARDLRLFSAELFYAEWGHDVEGGEATVAAMPRVCSLSQSHKLRAVLKQG